MEENRMIDTTINIGGETLNSLDDAASRLGITRSGVISALMKRYSRRGDRERGAWMRVKYQERLKTGKRRKVHVRLKEDEYEFFVDSRKVFKFSVSFIVAQAVELFLVELLEEIKKDADSYRYRNYAMMEFIIDNVITRVYYWGIPTKTLLLPHPGE